MSYAFFVSCASFYERTNFTPRNTVRHYSGNEEMTNNKSNYEYDEKLMQEGFHIPNNIIFSSRYLLHSPHIHTYV